jgi:iron-sulfur cluster assembly protein
VQQQLSKRGGASLGVRLGVRTAGCSGLSYTMEFADSRVAGDSEFESRGVLLFVDPRNLPYLAGTELDFVREGMSEGFKFLNPNSKGQCGCGESFTV